MRQLNARQKQMLDKVFMEAPNGHKPFDVDDLSTKVLDEIVALNDHETVCQNINRYLSDKWFALQRNL